VPYIDKDMRASVAPNLEVLEQRLARLRDLTDERKFDGLVNYTITHIVNRFYAGSYQALMRGVGTLECAKQEFYRRVVATYEDAKCVENGDVYHE
jgi:hypothetical protein